MPVSQLTATWSRLLVSDRLRRSSQVLSVVNQTVCIFGGEVLPRQPVDDQVDVFSLTPDVPKLETKAVSSAPSPRVGSASAALNGKMYLFSGRGGLDMAPVEENGALWCFEPSKSVWSIIDPADPLQPYPPARSYHCMATDGEKTLFVHAGCPAKDRLSDVWKFDTSNRTWAQAPDAPAPQRGGTSIAHSQGKLYRMNGFDGTTEQGGSVDIFDILSNTWTTKSFPADGNAGPEPRSVCALLPLKLQGKEKLLTLFGERDPSSLGHAGAGKMLGDVWMYDVGENWWTKVETGGNDGNPDPRGWFAADVIRGQDGKDSIVVHGGLGENNERLNDVWLLTF
ncbi:galactose oxidase [Lindgomyces ingoldianus]|uniref:Galactose oxidase n=1 Tax=Lindgomyces ingoldianus TaxID=673940 RepID=A0ACB6R9P0_9PLEO|nr:galactose oxidase [Lindgomyces ingoldianus]KAF2475906.1 galactose oxidase [Lindgomyces ingoldianus]